MHYNISKENIMTKYSWEDVQFRINQIQIDKLITIREGMKKTDIERAYRLCLCDEVEIKPIDMKNQYDLFKKRFEKAKTKI